MSIHGPHGLMSRAVTTAPLPYKDFDELLRRPVEAAIVAAWTQVLAIGDLDPEAATEVAFTRHLVDTLNQMLNAEFAEIDGFSASIFETIDRGCELCSYDNQHIEKKPDMVVRLAGRHPQIALRAYYGLFIECKIADKDHSMVHYCGDGLVRFIKGEYAWAMRSGIMIGYARQGYALPSQLQTHIQEYGPRYNTISGPILRPDDPPHAGSVFLTRHRRIWSYPSGGDPGDIEIAHIWLPTGKVSQNSPAIPEAAQKRTRRSASSPT